MKGTIAFTFISLISFSAFAENSIVIKQIGDNATIDIEQDGNSNVVKRWRSYDKGLDGDDNTLKIGQYKNAGSTSDKNVIEIRRVWGDDNQLALGQGYAVTSTGTMTKSTDDEYGDMDMHINITGNGNDISSSQTSSSNTTGHSFDLHLEGDDNKVHTRQKHGGGHHINLDIYNDDNDVTIEQKHGTGSHSTHIILNGSAGTDVDLLQQGYTNQSYSLNQYCVTAAGCSVSVTQGNW